MSAAKENYSTRAITDWLKETVTSEAYSSLYGKHLKSEEALVTA
jgi:hypothetical protein